MSLFKALDFKGSVGPREHIEGSFTSVVQHIHVKDGVPRAATYQIVDLLHIYIEESVQYLQLAAALTPSEHENTVLKFMNGFIAEAMKGADLKYFHQEGMTIIDLLLQKTLDKQEWLTDEEIEAVIADVEGSYFEEVDEEE